MVSAFTATDPEDDDSTLDWDLDSPDQVHFDIDDDGVLTFVAAPDFETPLDEGADNIYSLDVVVTDSDGETDTRSITVTVTDVNESPEITSAESLEAGENQQLVGTLTASDPEGDALSWSISDGGDSAAFSIDETTGELTFVETPDFESPADADANNIYSLEIVVTDPEGATDSQIVTIEVTDANDSPEITSPAEFEVPENQQQIARLTASDPEQAALSWSIGGGTDATAFVIDETSGDLSFVGIPDFENPTDVDTDNIYSIGVAVTDSGGATSFQTVVVNVTAENEAPTITSDTPFEAAENQQQVGTLTATDPENSELAWSIVGGDDASAFLLDSASGELTFAASPNFENPGDADINGVYDLVVSVADADNAASEMPISVFVTNVLEAPEIEVGDGNRSDGPKIVSVEMTQGETEVVQLVATDEEDDLAEIPLSWSITGGADADLFTVSESGAVSFLVAPDASADGDNIYELEVTVTDSDGQTDTTLVDVAVAEPELPVSVTINENVVIAVATNADDDVVLVLGDEVHVLTMGNREFEFDASVIDTINIGAGLPAASDSITVIGTDADETATMLDNKGTIRSADYEVNVFSFDSLLFEGAGGFDYGQVFGSQGRDELIGLPQDTKLDTPTHEFHMTGFERVDSFGRGGDDYAQVFGTNDSDLFYTFDGYEVLTGPNYQQTTNSFFRVDAFGRGGDDRALLFDTVGGDGMFAVPGFVVMQSAITKSVAKGFEDVEATSENGGSDTATLLGLTSADHLEAEGDTATLITADRTLKVKGFARVNAEAEEGETPTSEIADIDFILASEGDWLN